MSTIIFKDLTKRFDTITAVNRINLTIADGDFVTLLGPSGCGKTTTLRCLAGLEEPDGGEIYIDEACVFSDRRGINVAPGARKLGFVFQNYALWPHMTVNQNINFGLRKANLSKSVQEQKINKVLAMIGLDGLQNRYPHELSGGQQQRVAVARMVVTEPNIFLFDEPLSNLDAKLRMTLRAELKRMHMTLGATTVYVTHDQIEAMTLSSRIVVMKEGVIQQIDSPQNVYHFPANLFVADFMGNPSTNLIKATAGISAGRMVLNPDIQPSCSLILDAPNHIRQGQQVIINVRPEDVQLQMRSSSSDLNLKVYTTLPAGSEAITYLHTPDDSLEFIAKGPEASYREFLPEMEVGLRFKKGNIYDAASGKLLLSFPPDYRNMA